MPLAVAMLNVSNPGMSAMDALSRLSHDTDAEVAQNAVLALGALHLASLQHIAWCLRAPACMFDAGDCEGPGTVSREACRSALLSGRVAQSKHCGTDHILTR